MLCLIFSEKLKYFSIVYCSVTGSLRVKSNIVKLIQEFLFLLSVAMILGIVRCLTFTPLCLVGGIIEL